MSFPKVRNVFAALVIAALSSLNLDAALVTVEPDDFAPGTNLSTAVAGVTLSVESTAPIILGAPPNNSVFALTNQVNPPGSPPTGRLVFGTSATTGFGSSWYSGDNIFRADFTNPTDFVSIMAAADGDGDTDVAFFQIFNSFNVLLDSVTLTLNNTAQTASFSRLSSEIAYLRVSNPPQGPTGDSFLLDKLTFNSVQAGVPDGGSLLGIWIAFLVGAAVLHRRTVKR